MDGPQLRQRRRGGGDGFADDDKKRKSRITLESFDLYQKVQTEEAVQTTSGATVSLVSLAVIVILVLSEVSGYVFPRRQEHMEVDKGIEGKLRINFDISFPALNCAETNIDAMDVAGEQQNGLDHDISKTRLDGATGKAIGDAFAVRIEEKNETKAEPTPLPADYCGSCYGAEKYEGHCCNTCDDIRTAYGEKGWDTGDVIRSAEQCAREKANPAITAKEGEGCRLTGFMLVNKVAGNFHIAMGETHARGAGHIHQFNPATITRYNVSHTIHSLSFGLPYPGQHNPLDMRVQMPQEGAGVYMYYIKVIPTVYKRDGTNLTTNQYSVTSQYRPAVVNGQRQNVLPGLFFVYDISPFMVTVTEAYTTFPQLITSLCAILGGVITAATLVDAVLYRLGRTLKSGGTASGGTGSQAAIADALIAGIGSVQKVAGSGLSQALLSQVTSPLAGLSSSHGPGSSGSAAAAGGGQSVSAQVTSPIQTLASSGTPAYHAGGKAPTEASKLA